MQRNDDLRQAIQDEARRWLETPVRHQHQVLGFGVDCWKLIEAVGTATGVLTIDLEAFAPFASYGEQPSPKMAMGVAKAFLKPVTAKAGGVAGDIALIAWRPGLTMHFAILGDWNGRATLIHAYKPRGKVVEHGFVQEWPGLVHSWWRYPGVAGRG